MTEYREGHIKHQPETKSVAIRTMFPEIGDYASSAWLTVSSGQGGSFVPTSTVEAWIDLYEPPEPEIPSRPADGPPPAPVEPGGS
jgi:hypothetical protein